MDYLVPTASEAPTIDIAHIVSPSPLTPLGSKGLGESSSMTVPAVIANAVSDALSPLGIKINDLPMSPSKLWTIMERARTNDARPTNSSQDAVGATQEPGDESRVASGAAQESGERSSGATSRAGNSERAETGERSRLASTSGHPRPKPGSRSPLQ
jgi:hypothetical protein